MEVIISWDLVASMLFGVKYLSNSVYKQLLSLELVIGNMGKVLGHEIDPLHEVCG